MSLRREAGPVAPALALVLALALALCATGCVRGCASPRPPIHLNPNMDWQPKAQAQEASDFFYDGKTMRQPVPGTVRRGGLVADPVVASGKTADGAFVATMPVAADDRLLRRGLRQFTIYCQPCHDKRGTGNGILAQRGGVPTTSIHDQRIVAMPDGEMFDVITNGKGLMPAYAWPLAPHDRWAVIAWVRGLQRDEQAIDVAAAAPGDGGRP